MPEAGQPALLSPVRRLPRGGKALQPLPGEAGPDLHPVHHHDGPVGTRLHHRKGRGTAPVPGFRHPHPAFQEAGGKGPCGPGPVQDGRAEPDRVPDGKGRGAKGAGRGDPRTAGRLCVPGAGGDHPAVRAAVQAAGRAELRRSTAKKLPRIRAAVFYYLFSDELFRNISSDVTAKSCIAIFSLPVIS